MEFLPFYSICIIGIVRVGQESLLGAFYNGASKVGCSECVFEVLRKLGDECI
jgi:hypothetical protein